MKRALKTAPVCSWCKNERPGPRLVIDGRWMCSECIYELEVGQAERVPRPSPRNGPPQAETLFPLEESLRGK